MGRRVTLALGGSLLCLGVALLAIDAVGVWTLGRLESRRQRDIAAYRERASLPRPVLNAPPLEDDAAAWYRQAIAVAASRLSQADTGVLAKHFDDVEALEQHFDGGCVNTQPVLQGARCAKCYWGLAFQRPEPTDPTIIFMPARFIAYCLVHEGARRAEALDWQAALIAYFAVLRFSADLKLTNLLGTLIGIDVARMGLTGLGRMITKYDPEDSSVLPTLELGLARFAPHVLGVGEGPVVERLELLATLGLEAQAHAADDKRLGRLVPWHAVTAYRMYKTDNLLRRAEATATIEDYDARLRVAEAVNAEAANSWSPTLRTIGLSDWLRVRENADELVERYRMVQIAVSLEGWYRIHGEYPQDTLALRLSFEIPKLEYQPYAERQAYRLRPVSARSSIRSSAKLLLERVPRQSVSSQRSRKPLARNGARLARPERGLRLRGLPQAAHP